MNAFKMDEFKWLNKSKITEADGTLIMTAPPKTDFFIDPDGQISNDNAPYFYAEIEGDFVFGAKVGHAFKGVYDACTLMVMVDGTHWGKLCFELTDFGTRAIVSVVTKEFSDDANGVNVDVGVKDVRLQIARKGNAFAFHYALGGAPCTMQRLFSLPADARVRVGFVAQSPLGDGAVMEFSEVRLEFRTVENLRAGV